MKLNFKISEFNISGKPIPETVADKILKWHILPMQKVRDILGVAMWASQGSGYRSYEWELSKGRSGNSQHVFTGMGAVDWTCSDFANNKDKFLKLITDHTNYSRMAIYNSFIHCDYKPTPSGEREIYKSDSASNWELIKTL